MKPSLLAASILSADFSNLGDQIHQVEIAGVDWIHIDVMDGHFVPNITMGPFIVETVRKLTTLPIDVHLMIEKPENFISAFIKAGADYVSVHVEGNSNIHRTIQSIRANHAKAGIVINPGTPASAAFALLPFVDYILLMSVNPGYSGQVFIPEVLNKIPELRKQCLELGVEPLFEIDGGISTETIAAARAAGVDVFVAATAIFKANNGIAGGIQALRDAL